MSSSPAPREQLAERVDRFVKWCFRDYRPAAPRGPKVINDSLLGNQFFSRHEVAVIDSPLLQRLKRIKQTGLVYQVYPSATHSRFEHSLGTATIAERCLHAIQERAFVESGKPLANFDRAGGDLAHLRMAAMLHDVGHGLCSHASEQIYELLSDLQEFKRDPHFAKNAPGEILSYLIITSPTFRSWFEEHVVRECQAPLKLERIGEIILGRHPDHSLHFLAQIVSSPYDADKLDYIARDSYYCGLALTVDLPRFYSMISTAEQDGYRVLVLRNYVPLEQILFSKMMLFASVYHHQKAKCLDSMLRATIQHISENARECTLGLDGAEVSFADPVEYLYERQIHASLPDSTKRKCDRGEVLLSVPKRPSIKTDFAFVQTSPRAGIETIEKFFPVEQWTDAYAHNKWRSYVYAPRECARAVRDAAKELLRDKFNIDIDLAVSEEACHTD